MIKPKILCVMGPTASGKTALGLALAKAWNGEIINADARQLYRDAPIGTGVPQGVWEQTDEKEAYIVEGIPHHLMAVSTPDEAWTVSRWCRTAHVCVENILSRQKLPIIVGGTGLYLRAFTEGFVFLGEPDPLLRQRLLELDAEERVNKLLEQDSTAKNVIDLQNPHRVLRALERVLSGQPLVQEKQVPPFEFCKLGIECSPEILKQRIQATVHRQLTSGWVREVESLLEKGISETSPLMTSIGFRTIARHIREKTLDIPCLEEEVVHETWQYARRQRTWFKKEPQLTWIQEQKQAESIVQSFFT